MKPKYAYEYGRKWKAEVPRADVKWLLMRVHVGTPFEEIEANLRARMQDATGFTPTIVKQTVEYARIVHDRNRELYLKVTRG